ncbi:MAG: DUF2007 domain-containing protein [Gammaproteobacteria bacterium]|nr:MAG: DUF2007 domain-containing protein [Gammaproteobacteria bacterium]
MRRLYQAQDEIEAQLLSDYLAASHIPTTVLGRYQSAAAGELSALAFPSVWVLEDRDLPRARVLLAEFLQRRQGPGGAAAWHCECGEQIGPEFDLCWRCGRSRPP